jgi:hypothetical protein
MSELSDEAHDGKRVERLIIDWLGGNYPNGPTWYDRPATDWPPIEIVMIPAFDDIEYNLGNGGWAQYLWNCFGYWRQIIDVAKQGYLLIGAPEQSAALETLRTLCERDERECAEVLERSEREYDGSEEGPPYFAEFTKRSYSAQRNDWEPLFYGDEIYAKRLAWLAANEARIRKAVGRLE